MTEKHDALTRQSSFCVVLHDVAPIFKPQIEKIVRKMRPLIGSQMAAAVVPCWHGRLLDPGEETFVDLVQSNFDEILLHGYRHERTTGHGLISTLTGSSDEFNGLSRDEAAVRLRLGQDSLERCFSGPAAGFIAPTYQRGKLTAEILADHGLHYCVGFQSIKHSDGRRQRLATWCWDMGVVRHLGYVGHAIGHTLRRVNPSAVPCLALHPFDADRRFLKRAVTLVRALLAEGRQPVVTSEL